MGLRIHIFTVEKGTEFTMLGKVMLSKHETAYHIIYTINRRVG